MIWPDSLLIFFCLGEFWGSYFSSEGYDISNQLYWVTLLFLCYFNPESWAILWVELSGSGKQSLLWGFLTLQIYFKIAWFSHLWDGSEKKPIIIVAQCGKREEMTYSQEAGGSILFPLLWARWSYTFGLVYKFDHYTFFNNKWGYKKRLTRKMYGKTTKKLISMF